MGPQSSPTTVARAAFTSPNHNHLARDVIASRNNLEMIEDRLHTFTNWPYREHMAAPLMAAMGFYQHSRNSDAVSCFCCQVRIENWHEQSDPIKEHQRASPTCSWSNGTYMTTVEERFGSFHSWSNDIKPLSILLAAAGFYHSNKHADSVTCFSCKLDLRDWKKDDDPIKLHIEHASLHQLCQWISRITNQPQQYVPPTPPLTPPVVEAKGIAHRCEACNKTFSSGNKFHKHRREAHPRTREPLGIPLKKPCALKRSRGLFMGKHRVSKAVRHRPRPKRKGNTDLSGCS